MAIMTSADVLKVNNSEELIGVIDDVVKEIPELRFFAASPVTKNTFKTLAVETLPTVGFRDPAGLRTFDTVGLANHEIACKYLDASWTLPVAIAQQCDWGEDFAKALETKAHLKSAFFALSKQIWTGTSNDANGFVGFDALIAAVDSGAMVITANESASDASSVYAVRTGIDSAQLAWGSNGKFDEGDVLEQMLYTQETEGSGSGATTVTKGAWHYAQKLGGWVGLQVTSKYAAAKIANLSATSSKVGLDDDLLYQLIEKFPASVKPNGIFMSRRSFSQLRQSRTAYNVTGAPAPYPNDFEGIPIYITDAIA